MADVHFIDNSQQFKDAKDEAILRALEAIGMTAEGYAKMKCPVDTGLLRNSITHAVGGDSVSMSYHAQYGSNRNSSGKRINASLRGAGSVGVGRYNGTVGQRGDETVYIGTNVEYAAYVEFGTVNTPPQPYLKPAVMDHTGTYERILKSHLKGEE